MLILICVVAIAITTVTRAVGRMLHMGQSVIKDPMIVFLNLAGTDYETIAAEDRALIGPLFGRNVQVATARVPCDVLFLYCNFEPSGKIVGQEASHSDLRNLLRDSRAKIAVIASPVIGYQYSASGDNPPVNVVFTLDRKGDKFGRFFRSMFELMWTRGLSMPMAWNLLAPPSRPHQHHGPDTWGPLGAGHVAFVTGKTTHPHHWTLRRFWFHVCYTYARPR
jgi:hypothetical protein